MALFDTNIKLGLLTISSSWVGMLTALSLALWLIKREVNRIGFNGAKISDAIFDSIFYGPLQILLGGFIPYASWIGWGIGIGYFVMRFRKHPMFCFPQYYPDGASTHYW
ncbi:hypothetical protein [Effusibacillus consociatus]|uniref:Prolipoprotein diacylglyceryl transferase n=1 Tax=Effusibacillus consociatus TaxID=1117041 RepID=A0ABV9Q0G6_9BACL